MFNGVVREIAVVKKFSKNRLYLKTAYRPNIGDSIAVNGACLSVSKIHFDGFEVDLSEETKSKIALERYAKEVHIEPAMKLQDKIEGHLIQGHIDCIGEVLKIEKKPHSYDFYIKIPKEFIKFIPPKGSVAIDGISLTVNDVFKESFRVTIIPLTFQTTLFNRYQIGTRLNIETDMFARYIYHILSQKNSLSWSDIDKIMAIY